MAYKVTTQHIKAGVAFVEEEEEPPVKVEFNSERTIPNYLPVKVSSKPSLFSVAARKALNALFNLPSSSFAIVPANQDNIYVGAIVRRKILPLASRGSVESIVYTLNNLPQGKKAGIKSVFVKFPDMAVPMGYQLDELEVCLKLPEGDTN